MSTKLPHRLLVELLDAADALMLPDDAISLLFLRYYRGPSQMDGVRVTQRGHGTAPLSVSVEIQLSFPEARTSPESLQALQATLEP